MQRKRIQCDSMHIVSYEARLQNVQDPMCHEHGSPSFKDDWEVEGSNCRVFSPWWDCCTAPDAAAWHGPARMALFLCRSLLEGRNVKADSLQVWNIVMTAAEGLPSRTNWREHCFLPRPGAWMRNGPIPGRCHFQSTLRRCRRKGHFFFLIWMGSFLEMEDKWQNGKGFSVG